MSGYAAKHGRNTHYSPRHKRPSPAAKIAAGAGVSGGSLALVAGGMLTGISPAQAVTSPVAHSPAYAGMEQMATRKVATETRYTVRRGDTLSSIAKREYGHASRWPSLWYVNRRQVHNPNAIRTGERLTLSSWHPRRDWLLSKALRHVPPPPRVVLAVSGTGSSSGDARASSQPAVQPVADSQPAQGAAPGSFRACVLSHESGGNYSAVNPSSGAGGAYQFLQSTWSGLGFPGSPQDASPAMQDAAFQKEYAQSGTSAWAPYDGC